ncbi:MAG: serine hydrolase [Deltaproteobacteria bacterium]|nr:serine hydrolase [Deltaproteobacteria bacterium]
MSRRHRAALVVAATVVGWIGWMGCANAGHVLFDVAERRLLESADAEVPVPPGRIADLLLVAVLRERIASGDVSLADRVTVLPVAGDRGPHLSAQEPIEVGDLLQLLLLGDSRTAAKTLAWTAGPSIGRCLARMQQLATRLGLARTSIADDWPFAASLTNVGSGGQRGATTARDLGRLALTVVTDAELRRRLGLDGVPISNGGLIARATDPLIAVESGTAAPPAATSARLALVERDGLELLVVAAGPSATDELTTTIDRAFQRYRRIELVREGQAVGPAVRVHGGIIPTFKAVAAEGWALTTRQTSPPALAFRLQLPTEVAAPVEVRQPVGELVVEQDGRLLAVVPLVAPQAIAPSGWLDTAHRGDLP